jgi:NAD(P)-dependent dehydrogenase (short-subunit alcohol dehydrogenase family)
VRNYAWHFLHTATVCPHSAKADAATILWCNITIDKKHTPIRQQQRHCMQPQYHSALARRQMVGDHGEQRACPMKRPGQPAELATAYVMLADPLSSYVSGATIAVTGGKPFL